MNVNILDVDKTLVDLKVRIEHLQILLKYEEDKKKRYVIENTIAELLRLYLNLLIEKYMLGGN